MNTAPRRRSLPLAHGRVSALVGAVVSGVVLGACTAAPAVSSSSPDVAASSPARIAATSMPVASAVPSASPVTTADGPPQGDDTAAGLDGAMVMAVSATPDGMVAVGSSDGSAAAWTSADGAAWEPLSIGDAAAAVPTLRAVALAGDTGVVFGGSDDDPSRQWTTTGDGRGWATGSANGIDGRVNAVAGDVDGANGAARWVAVGDAIDAETGTAAAGAVWTSDDRQRWERSAELTMNEGTLSDVAVDGQTVVVVGFDVEGGRVWTSTSGDLDLRPVDTDVFAVASIEGVVATSDGFVALGRGLGDLRPVVWTSADGRRWTRDGTITDVFGPDRQINDLARVDGRLVAVGSAPDGGVVWTSDDGRSWAVGG